MAWLYIAWIMVFYTVAIMGTKFNYPDKTNSQAEAIMYDCSFLEQVVPANSHVTAML